MAEAAAAAPETAGEAQAEVTRNVNLVSQEGDSFDVSVKVAKMSELVKTMVSGLYT